MNRDLIGPLVLIVCVLVLVGGAWGIKRWGSVIS